MKDLPVVVMEVELVALELYHFKLDRNRLLFFYCLKNLASLKLKFVWCIYNEQLGFTRWRPRPENLHFCFHQRCSGPIKLHRKSHLGNFFREMHPTRTCIFPLFYHFLCLYKACFAPQVAHRHSILVKSAVLQLILLKERKST